MIEILIVALIGIMVLLKLAPSSQGRGPYDPMDAKRAEARSSLTFMTDDEPRSIEYEHRFASSRTGMFMDPDGYRVKRRRE